MKQYRLKWPILSISGVFVILLYCLFTFISWSLYPEAYGPVTHYLSRLGNFNYSPYGAFFYNLGCILTGIALVPFFIGFYKWYTPKLYQRILLTTGQLIGLCSAVALIMIGVYSEDQGSPHFMASSTFFLLNFFTLISISITLLLHADFFKPIALYGIAINFLSLAFELTIGGPLVEWFTVFGSLLFVGFISLNTINFHQQA